MNILPLTGPLGHAAVAFGLGGPEDNEPTPAFIRLPASRPLYALRLRAAVALYTITLKRVMAIIHVGDTALISPVLVRNAAGTLVDPDAMTVDVIPPAGDAFTLTWNTTPDDGNSDAITRTAVGTFSIQIDCTEERGAGLYRYVVTTTGAKCVEEGDFRAKAPAS